MSEGLTTIGPWKCSYCGAPGEGTDPHGCDLAPQAREQLTQIADPRRPVEADPGMYAPGVLARALAHEPLTAEVEVLAAEVERLRAENGMLRADLGDARDGFDRWREIANDKAAEVARLRAGIHAALEAPHCPGDPACEHDDHVWLGDAWERLEAVRALLAETGGA